MDEAAPSDPSISNLSSILKMHIHLVKQCFLMKKVKKINYEEIDAILNYFTQQGRVQGSISQRPWNGMFYSLNIMNNLIITYL